MERKGNKEGMIIIVQDSQSNSDDLFLSHIAIPETLGLWSCEGVGIAIEVQRLEKLLNTYKCLQQRIVHPSAMDEKSLS